MIAVGKSVWDDISHTPEEAANMKARSELLRAINKRIAEEGWTQTVTAEKLGISQPRVSLLVNGRISEFGLDTLVTLGDRLGVHVHVVDDHELTPA